MSDRDTNKNKGQKIQDMKKVLYKKLFIDTQFHEIINFYRHNHTLSTIEKEKEEKLLQQIDKKANPTQHNEVSSRLAFYSRYPWYLRENIFLMLFSLIEELLSSAYEFCWEQDFNAVDSGIKRFKIPYRNIGVDLTSITRCVINGDNPIFSCQEKKILVISFSYEGINFRAYFPPSPLG